jgi:hypothetical protein
LHGRDGELGKAKGFYFDDRHWAVRYLVAETGTWLSERRVLLSPYALLAADKEKRRIMIDLTKKQITDNPSLSTDKPVSLQFEESYYSYYGWPVYWDGANMWGDYPLIVRDPGKKAQVNSGGKPWNHHLRSSREVAGYRIEANDGEIGHVDDYIIDDETWGIRYLVVDTRNWLPGRKVLISPKWIERVSWEDLNVTVDLSREAIKNSPEYSEGTALTRDYETKLHGHYNRAGYWIKDSAVAAGPRKKSA